MANESAQISANGSTQFLPQNAQFFPRDYTVSEKLVQWSQPKTEAAGNEGIFCV